MPNITITQEQPNSADSMLLIAELDAQLGAMGYPDHSRHGFSVDKLVREGVLFFVTRCDGIPAGCGGLKIFEGDYAEVKRMFVRPQYRGQGLSKQMLNRLVECARENQIHRVRLETGIHQKEAIHLYEGFGFKHRAPFGEYKQDPNSIYFEINIA